MLVMQWKLSLLLSLLLTVDAYSDLRGVPCMTNELKNSIPADRVDWSGTIQLEMACLDGYDFPLNKPTRGLFNCLPDGSTWDPPIFPDCNVKTVPTMMHVLFAVSVPEHDCIATSATRNRGDRVQLSSPKDAWSVSLCPSNTVLEDCEVLSAVVLCDLTKANAIEKTKLLPVETQHVHMAVKVAYSPSISWSQLTDSRIVVEKNLEMSMRQHFKQNLTFTTKSTVKVTCTPGTRALLKDGEYPVCRGCSLGHYLDPKTLKCRPCAPGYFSDLSLQTSCRLCPTLRNVTDSKVWDLVRQSVSDGAYAMVVCPNLRRDAQGKLKIEVPDIEAARKRGFGDPEVNQRYYSGNRASVTSSPIWIIGLTLPRILSL